MMITIVFAIVAKKLLLLFYLTDFHGADKIEKKNFPELHLSCHWWGRGYIWTNHTYARICWSFTRIFPLMHPFEVLLAASVYFTAIYIWNDFYIIFYKNIITQKWDLWGVLCAFFFTSRNWIENSTQWNIDGHAQFVWFL